MILKHSEVELPQDEDLGPPSYSDRYMYSGWLCRRTARDNQATLGKGALLYEGSGTPCRKGYISKELGQKRSKDIGQSKADPESKRLATGASIRDAESSGVEIDCYLSEPKLSDKVFEHWRSSLWEASCL
jgi:hypothetical protein